MADPTTGTAAGRYAQMETTRDHYLDRARDCSILTIPALLPPEGHNSTSPLYQPFQSVGARGVNNLTAKLLLTQFPQESPFFRMAPDPRVKRQLENDKKLKAEMEKALGEYERTILDDIAASGDQVALEEALKHLIVAGNVLLYIGEDGIKVFTLERFVCRRDAMGRAVEMVVKESFDYETLPDEVAALTDEVAALTAETPDPTSASTTKTIDVYTHIRRRKKQWIVHQELGDGTRVPDSDGQFALDKTPWLALRMRRIDGEDYGRSYVEELLGDLKSLEVLTRALVEGSAAAAKILFLVKANGTTKMSVLAKAPNGGFREGNADDVTVLKLDKASDLSTAETLAERIERNLELSFLLNTAVQRDAERVTAEEIRYIAQELEESLGGVYSILSLEFQRPYVARKQALLLRQGRLPKLPKGMVRIKIITGLDALTRGHDKSRLMAHLRDLIDLFGQEYVLRKLSFDEVASRLATADGIDSDGLYRSEEEIAAADQQAQAQQMVDQLVQGGAPEAGKQIAAAIGGQANAQTQGNSQTATPAGG